MKEIWLYNDNEDSEWGYSGEFSTKEGAIKCAKEDDSVDGTTIFVGKKKRPAVCEIDVDCMLEQIAINTTEGFDDYADGFLENINKEHFDELEKKLNEVFLEWMYKYKYEPAWFEVIDIEEVDINK